jgi:hypothetical protein
MDTTTTWIPPPPPHGYPYHQHYMSTSMAVTPAKIPHILLYKEEVFPPQFEHAGGGILSRTHISFRASITNPSKSNRVISIK